MYKIVGESNGSKMLFAMKRFFANDEAENGIPYSALREIVCMKRLRTFPNRFIVKIIDVVMYEGS